MQNAFCILRRYDSLKNREVFMKILCIQMLTLLSIVSVSAFATDVPLKNYPVVAYDIVDTFMMKDLVRVHLIRKTGDNYQRVLDDDIKVPELQDIYHKDNYYRQ